MKRLPSDDPNIALFEGSTGNRIRIYVDGSHSPSIGGRPESDREWNALAMAELRIALDIVEREQRQRQASERNRRNRESVASDDEVLAAWHRYVESNEAEGKRATVSGFAKTRPFGLHKSAVYAKIPTGER